VQPPFDASPFTGSSSHGSCELTDTSAATRFLPSAESTPARATCRARTRAARYFASVSGGFFNAVRNAENSPIDGRCNERIVPDAGGARCDELRKAADRDQTIAVVGFVAGGILAAGSAVLYVMAGSDAKPDRVQALTCRPEVTRAGVGAGCTLSF